MRKVFAIFMAVFLGLTLAACGKSAATPENVAVEFMTNIWKGKTDALVEQIYLSEADKAKPGINEMVSGKLQMIAGQAKAQAEAQGGVASVSVIDKQVDEAGGTAIVQVETKFKQGTKTDTSKVKLRKDGDVWKVKL